MDIYCPGKMKDNKQDLKHISLKTTQIQRKCDI